MITYLDEKVWGPLYWKFLYTVALTYPNHPNDVTKRKYYDLIMNFPLFYLMKIWVIHFLNI